MVVYSVMRTELQKAPFLQDDLHYTRQQTYAASCAVLVVYWSAQQT